MKEENLAGKGKAEVNRAIRVDGKGKRDIKH
jgi:hypothetical protein